MVTGKGIKSADQKFALLLHLAGEEIQDLYDTFPVACSSSKENAYERLIRLLNEHFSPKKNTTYERHMFRGLKQNSETTDAFLTKLKVHANKCEFGSEAESNIREQFIEGCEDKELRRRILEKGDEADLEEIVRMAKSLEIGRRQGIYVCRKSGKQVTKFQKKTRIFKSRRRKTAMARKLQKFQEEFWSKD